MTKIIGLTGGIGSGKSTVARLLAELGAVIIDADELGHEVFHPGTEAWREIVATFGQQVLSSNDEIDRAKLGKIVFNNPEALARLNQIMHPRIYEMAKGKIEEYQRRDVGVVVLEAPLLIEAKWRPLVDEVWVTTAPETEILERLKKQRGLTPKEIQARIRSQLPVEERLKRSDVVINNESGIDELKSRVTDLWTRLTSNVQ